MNFFADLFDNKKNIIFLMLINAYLVCLFLMGVDRIDNTGLFNTYVFLYALLIAQNIFDRFGFLKILAVYNINLVRGVGVQAYLSARWTEVKVPRLMRGYFLFKLIIYVVDYGNEVCLSVFVQRFWTMIEEF
jgi:hypothetical protein